MRNHNRTILVLLAAGAFLMTANVVIAVGIELDIKKSARAAAEVARPARLSVMVIAPEGCGDCADPSRTVAFLKAQPGVIVEKEETVGHAADAARAFATRYGLTSVPAVVITGETEKALARVSGLKTVARQSDAALVLERLGAPYLELAGEKVRGRFAAVYLADRTCVNCYDPTRHRAFLAGFGMKPETEETVDRSDPAGAAFIKKYRLTYLPTVVLRGDVEPYQSFVRSWSSVGTVEADGAYVFRGGAAFLGPYRDLATGRIVTSTPPTQ